VNFKNSNYDFERLLQDFGLPYHIGGRGYIDIPCPWCGGGSKWKGGLHPVKGFYCWKCGKHPIQHVIKLLTGQDWPAIRNKYSGEPTLSLVNEEEQAERPQTLEMPEDLLPFLRAEHRNYLAKRGFTPDHIIKEWGVMATGKFGDYNYRLIIPVFDKGQMVSYLGRDWTGQQHLRYKTCEKKKEVVHHKHLLYGLEKCTRKTGVICEGSTDVWRLGPGAVATLGTGYTSVQARLIRETFNRVFIVFDPEPEAQARARKLGEELAGVGVEVENVKIDAEDPGAMSQTDADTMMKDLLA
jgi:hypothetical protein